MPRHVAEENEWEDEGDWRPDDDRAGDDDDGTVPCPYCQRPMHEDSPRCPHCENYISKEDAPPRRKPWWIVLGCLLCFYVIYRWIFLN